MSQPIDEERDEAAELHDMLLRLAASLPDAFLAQCRAWLAQHDVGRLARSVCFTVATGRIPLSEREVVVLSKVLADGGADPGAVAAIAVQEDPDQFAPLCDFTAAGTAVPPPAGEPADEALIDAIVDATGRGHLIGLWRVWRVPLAGSHWRKPRWVYLLEAPRGTDDLAVVTGRVQQALAAAGETDPLVETFAVGQPLPVYQRFALGGADLLWSSTPDAVPSIAALFDAVDPADGPGFAVDHERIDDDEECKRIIGYLDAGEPLMSSMELMPDVVDSRQPLAVPMDIRTDGVWIWPDAAQYYLSVYRLAPDPGLLRHIRAAGYRPAPCSMLGLYQAIRVLNQPADEEPAWAEPA